MTTGSDDMLAGFEDSAAIKRKSLLDLSTVDLAGTTITYAENGQGGYRVAWKREFAPLQVWMDSYAYFIGAGLCALGAILFLVMGSFNLGSILIAVSFGLLGGYMVLKGYNELKAEYVFELGLDQFWLDWRHPAVPQLFDKKVGIPYDELRSFDLGRTGTEDNWGLALSVQTKSERFHVTGQPRSIELLKGILEVLLLKVRGSRKKQNLDDHIRLV